MSGRRGRPPKGDDDLTARETTVLEAIESAPDGISASEMAARMGVTRSSVNVWLYELSRRELAHGVLPHGANKRTPFLWYAGPESYGPSVAPEMCRAIPSIFHVGLACT